VPRDRSRRAGGGGDQQVPDQPHGPPPGDLRRIDEAVQAAQIARLRDLRAGRDATAVAGVLSRLRAAAQEPAAPLMPLFVEAVAAYATLGEICNTPRSVFGEYRP
jgi:methylmalonyl-CoA mutase N-terminal domain/subunit